MDIFEVKLIEVPDLFKVSIITGTSIIVNSDNTYNAIAYNGQTFVIPDTPWIDSDGTPMTSPATTPIVCSTPVGCDVENSDGTYGVHVNNGGTLVLPDTEIKNTAGATILTQPSATNTGVIADCRVVNSDLTYDVDVPAETTHNLPDIQFTDSTGAISSVPACKDIVATPAPTPTYASARVMKTGQTTSYRTGDDGDLENGREVSFFVLKENNPFGNTTRFTDILGGATYSDNVVLDWSTFDGTTVLGYVKNFTTLGLKTWANAIDGALAYTTGTFLSGWRLINVKEFVNIMNYAYNGPLNYAPFSAATGNNMWTSTTLLLATGYAYAVDNTSNVIAYVDKNSTAFMMPVRTFSVSGTTIT